MEPFKRTTSIDSPLGPVISFILFTALSVHFLLQSRPQIQSRPTRVLPQCLLVGIFDLESVQGAALDKTIDDVSPPAPSGRHYEGHLSGRKFPGQFKIVVSVSCNSSMWCCRNRVFTHAVLMSSYEQQQEPGLFRVLLGPSDEFLYFIQLWGLVSPL